MLSFDTLWQIESVNPSKFDLMQVQVIPVSVLGFGDSVAAGYGLGYSEGLNDNPGAYPAVLAKTLGVQSQDYAVEGACASASEPKCKAQSMDWQIAQVPANVTPGVVTVTVGANDIHFGDCLASIVQNSDINLTSPSDPCSPTNLATNLAALQASLTTDLQTLASKYPSATILVMHYYNPFPQPPGFLSTPCLLDQLVTLQYEHSQGESWGSVVAGYFQHPLAFHNKANGIQGDIYNDAQNVIGQLNSTIDAAASGVSSAITIDPSDFTGHDMCQAPSNKWIFSPRIVLRLTFRTHSKDITWGDPACPAPVNEKPLVDKTVKFPGGSLYISAKENCIPHPTKAGQAALANDFYQQG